MWKAVCSVLLFAMLACSTQTTVKIQDSPPWYFPAVLEVAPGTSVSWDNSMAAVVHPVNILSGPEKFASGHFTAVWNYTFTAPGIYHYFCPIHPYMQGLIGVGMDVPDDRVPSWLPWPPAAQQVPGAVPSQPGVGEVWLDAQFQVVRGKPKPGTIIVIDASTWKVKRVIDDKHLNNPHNLWLSEDGNHVLQTNWFDKYISVIDRYSGLVLRQVYVGESPAHVMTARGKIYVTIQGDDGIVVLDSNYETLKTLRTINGTHDHGDEHADAGRGPHGHWISGDSTRMAVAHTEGRSIAVWDLTHDEKVFEHTVDPLPLFAGISADGTRAWTASLVTGKFSVFDVDKKQMVKEYIVGKSPIQAVPSPDGKYILVALSGEGSVAVLNASTFDTIKVLPTGAGAHAISYGPKAGGGMYAYVSHKFVSWIGVIDMDRLEVAGYVSLPRDALGGQGILAVS